MEEKNIQQQPTNQTSNESQLHSICFFSRIPQNIEKAETKQNKTNKRDASRNLQTPQCLRIISI